MNKLLFSLIIIFSVPAAIFAQNDSINKAENSKLRFGLNFFAADYDSGLDQISKYDLIEGGVNYYDKLGAGLGFLVEHRTFSKIYFRVEPRAMFNRSFVGNPEGGISEFQLPILIKLKAYQNIFLLGGYLASIKLNDDLFAFAIPVKRTLHSIEAGIGIDLKITNGLLGLSLRGINQLTTDVIQGTSLSQLNKMINTSAIMLHISFEGKGQRRSLRRKKLIDYNNLSL